MFRIVTLAILMAGVLMVTTGLITQTCTETTDQNGDITSTCRDVGIIITREDGTEVVLHESTRNINLSYFPGAVSIRFGNTYIHLPSQTEC